MRDVPDEELQAQKVRLAATRDDLGAALARLGRTASAMSKVYESKRGEAALEALDALMLEVKAAEEQLLFAKLDLATAGGADA